MKKKLGYASGAYGVLHAVGCPYHGGLALALKMGLTLPGTMTTVLQYPHDVVTHHVFEPAWRMVLREEKPSHHHHNHGHSHAGNELKPEGSTDYQGSKL